MRKLYIFIFFFACTNAFAQWTAPQLELSAEGYVSGGKQAPFWLINGQNGRFQPEKHNLLTAVTLQNEPLHDSLKWAVEYGLEADFAINNTDNYVWLQQGYVKARAYWLELMAGRYYSYQGNGDSTLSSGYLLYSNNARPLPKVGLGSRGWVDVPYTRGYIELKGLIEHGWFENDRYVRNSWFHHKNFYVRLGGDFPVNFSGGLDHYAQWGGTSSDPEFGKFPSDFETFIDILLSANADSSDASLPDNERYNRVGDHLGSWNWRLDVDTEPVNIALYYQTIFEDKSGYVRKIDNEDGLWGLALRLKDLAPLQKIVVEFIKTTYQSGDTHIRGERSGRDNYFNNSLYRNGWSYHRFTIGSPFITSPFYFGDENRRFLNNRVMAYYLGLTGVVGNIRYEWRSAYSQNKGTYAGPFDPERNQLSFLLKLQYVWQDVHKLELSSSLDHGEMFGNNVGIGLAYRYRMTF